MSRKYRSSRVKARTHVESERVTVKSWSSSLLSDPDPYFLFPLAEISCDRIYSIYEVASPQSITLLTLGAWPVTLFRWKLCLLAEDDWSRFYAAKADQQEREFC
jgi:hypothetical protein